MLRSLSLNGGRIHPEHLPVVSVGEPAHYFRMIKELTLLGYFTSEIGSTQALRFAPVPGRFDPCLEYPPGERSWSP